MAFGLIIRLRPTRELVFPPWPYIVVYEILDSEVRVLHICHASQDWP
ncbi:MAG: type II toxin-antitoxin system RelE/ParE family toxin [Acidobacteriia bacterium]|nr:type II toxin-antitoxin system RelE/ParE family toxin [Terriglobia bacterium]